MTDYEQRLLKKLRAEPWVTEAQMSDERVLKVTKGSFLEAGARVEIFEEDLAECFRPLIDAMLFVFLWISRRMQR